MKDFDGYLDWLANNPGRNSIKLGVVLSVHGVEVSGELVTEDEYLKGVRRYLTSSYIESTASLELEKKLRQEFSEKGEEADRIEEAIRVGRENTLNLVIGGFEPSGEDVRYIHLRDFEVRNGFGSSKSSWWRGRLSSVDGFTIGSKQEDANNG